MVIALYLRLSKADGDLRKNEKEESNSIENQRLMLEQFVASRDDLCGEIREYVDDGYTGTNFDRPAFMRMIEDAKKGTIQAIVVKDFSRLGRDYIGVGDYLEQIFPVLGVRFIAVNSNYDSANYIGRTMGLEMSISNLINSLYSKDVSKKYRSAVRTKWKQGKSTMGRVPFGYVKCNGDPAKWEIDPVASRYVRTIFEKAMQGWGTGKIVNYLNEHKIPTAGQYREMTSDYQQWNRVISDEEWMWDTAMVWRILRKYSYTGALVQGVTVPVRVGSKMRRNAPKHERFIVDNVHPAIVTVEEFNLAQEAIHSSSTHSMPQLTGFPLGGKIRCGNCGLSMAYIERGASRTIACRHRQYAGRYSKCDNTVYQSDKIEGIVYYTLRMKLAQFQNVDSVFREDEKTTHQDQDKRKIERDIAALKTRRIYQYEVYAEGIITKEEYLADKESFTEQIDRLQKQLDMLIAMSSTEKTFSDAVSEVAAQAESVSSPGKLTKEVADAFVKSVVIYGPDRIEISFTFDDLLEEALKKQEAPRS